MREIVSVPYHDLADDFAAPSANQVISLYWLGQAGFAMRWNGLRIVIDPYLSDFLAIKYRGSEFAHQRLMAAPVLSERLKPLDYVLCTHRHSDHMDPGTLPVLAAMNPNCWFVVPQSELMEALNRGVPKSRAIGMDAGGMLELRSGLKIEAVASAHEELQINDRGECGTLGYILHLGDFPLYHSGDCVPYPGLAEKLRGGAARQNDSARAPQLALLPINGRDDYRKNRKVPGNFTFDEAVALCREAGIPLLVGHHFGMFEFNTLDIAALKARIHRMPSDIQVIFPDLENRLDFACSTV